MSAPTPKASIGSFVFEAPLPLSDPRLARLNAATVSNSVDGTQAIAFRVSLAHLNALDVTQLRERLERRTAIRTAGVVRVLEASIAGPSAFAIESPPAVTRISDELAAVRDFSPSDIVAIVRELTASLATARITHGQISSELVWLAETGLPVLGGFSFVEPASGADVKGLAELAFEVLSRTRFDPNAFVFPAGVRTERLREALPGVTAQFAGVIAAGTNGDFSSPGEFANALESAASDSAADLAMAAHQAIAVKDSYGANLFLDLGRRYQPDHPELTAVALRLSPGSLPTDPLPPQIDISIMNTPYVEESIETTYDPASEQARFLAALKASIPEVSTKKAKFPWAAIVAGMVGMFGIVTVVAFLVVQSR